MNTQTSNVVSGGDAVRLSKENRFNKIQSWVQEFDGVANIRQQPKFRLNEQDRFFTIGSCFARMVENQLLQRGISLVTPPKIGSEYYQNPLKNNRSATGGYSNVYTPGSILEFSRLVQSPDPFHSIVEMKGCHHDLLAHFLKGLTVEKSKEVRSGLIDTYQKIADVDVMIITLGHIEAWYYKKTEAWINHTMADAAVRGCPEDYLFILLGIKEVIEMLEQALENFLRANPKLKFIFTVSPVHLRRTYTKDHIVVANQRSKSTLLAAAQYLNAKYDVVDYFPSYELVTQTDRKAAYQEDGSHVKPSMTRHVMQTFFATYLKSD